MGLFENKVVLVTGAAEGIGRESALEFARQGAKLTLAGIHKQGLDETAKLIADIGGESIVVITDVSEHLACSNVLDQTIAAFGQLNVVINISGASDRVLR